MRCERPGEAAPCPHCASEGHAANLTTVHDLEAAKGPFLAGLERPGLAADRYAALLPVDPGELVSQDVGGTPLLDAPRLAEAVGVARLWIKDESRGPTWSFKDRAASIGAAHARALGAPGIVAASTGNAAAATAAHARRAGLPAVLLFARGVDPIMSAFARAYGAQVFVAPTKADRWALMRHCVQEHDLYPCSNYADPPIGGNPFALDGYKAIGFEIWEQLGRRTPDAVYLSVCYGDALFGVFKAFEELRGMGLAGPLPRLSGGEVYGSLERALAAGADAVAAVDIDRATAAFSASANQSTYQALHAVRRSGGWVSSTREPDILAAQRLIAETEGLFVETASALAVAALAVHLESGRLARDAEVVVVNSSTGVKSVLAQPQLPDPPPVRSVEELTRAMTRRRT